jgi:hypothetical protein
VGWLGLNLTEYKLMSAYPVIKQMSIETTEWLPYIVAWKTGRRILLECGWVRST